MGSSDFMIGGSGLDLSLADEPWNNDDAGSVWALGIGGTGVEVIGGIKAESGFYLDFGNKEVDSYSTRAGGTALAVSLTGYDDQLAAGLEGSGGVTLTRATSMNYFRGDSISTSTSYGMVSVDMNIAQDTGPYWGVTFGPSYGHSVVKTHTDTYPIFGWGD